MMRMAEMVERHRFMMLGPVDVATGRPMVVAELVDVEPTQVDLLRRLLGPNLGAGFAIAVDGEVVTRGPDPQRPGLAQVQHLTEMAVQQHEYLCAELRRMRDEYEQEFAQERVILRTLRQRWLERICDDRARGEDALRYAFETIVKKVDPPKSSGE
jgi:hypothetical protein